jgi:acyl-CoA synthetase (AMP-forming)/AMP-acid ligase II
MSGGMEIPLSPTSFLHRAGSVFADRTAILDGDLRFTYQEFCDRSRRLAALLIDAGVQPGDRVAALCVNSHVMLELHNGVPMAGSVLVPVNVRLSVAEMAHIIKESGARLVFATEELAETAMSLCECTGTRLILAGTQTSEYEQLLENSQPRSVPLQDEKSLLAINYTSGSTGRPKGAMYSHRGAYLQSLAMAYHARLGLDSRYLWTLPMFHCNGWCFTWAVTAAGGTHVCQRRVDAAEIWRKICDCGITHLSGAPTLFSMIAEAASAMPGCKPERQIHVQVGGAPPSPALLARLTKLNMKVTHLYGLTETYGPAVVNEWQPAWSEKPLAEQTRLNARQGVGNVATESVSVFDSEGREVPADGETVGEIVIRGNNVMMGYYQNEEATAAAHMNGWFRTGDLGVRHADGYIELKDRAKDIIITGGENVSSVEIERVLVEHPAVLEAAVVGRADEHWGEVPVAFVTLRSGMSASATELIDFVRGRIAHFKAPNEIRFEELPKTSTGKIRKYDLRARLKASLAQEQHGKFTGAQGE